MVRRPLGRFVRYAAAAISVAVGIGCRLALVHVLGPTVPYVTFFPAVMFSAWFGGFGPGVFASILTLVLAFGLSLITFGGTLKPSVAGAAGGLIFLAVSIFISVLTEALRRSRDLLRTTLASIADCIIALDSKGKVTFINSAAEKLTGWSQRDAEGKAIQEVLTILNERTRLPMEVEALRAMREGTTVNSADDAVLVSRDGREVLIEESAAPIRAEHGGVLGAVLVFRDVTQRRESQRALKLINQDLTRANRGLEEFAYVASHDLQEPLRMVSIYTQLIAERVQNSEGEIKRYATYVREGVQRMTAIIGDLLEYSRSSHAEEASVGCADLSESLSQAQATLVTEILESGAIITATALPKIRGETSQMSHVFQNILSNAIKYRKRGTCPKIDIRAEREGAQWVISIQDDGIGFEPQYAERIFGLFKRLHKGEYPGTGLGLAICQRIIERYGGQIWAESALGNGATFRFRLPSAE